MKFYFCESCNRRITDADLAAGAGKDKKAKGVYCKSCAAGVNTMEFDALSDTEAREVLSKTAVPSPRSPQRPISSSNATPNRSTTRVVEKASSRAGNSVHTAPSKQATWILIAGAAGGLIGVVVLMMLFSGGDSKSPKSAARSAEPEKTSTPMRPVSEQTVTDPAAKPAPKTEEVHSGITKPAEAPGKPAPVDAKPARSADDLAADAFEAAMKKINALGEEKLSERQRIADEFLAQYSETMQAARMRVIIQGWTAPKPPPAPEVAAPATEPADTASTVNDKETRILFECSPATEQGLACYSSGNCEEAEVFGTKSRAWKAVAVPNPPWHSTSMSVQVQGRAKGPVKITPNSWVRFACHLENGKNLMMHVPIGKGLYEIHQSNLPEKKWFWATFKMSDFSRNIWAGDAKPKAGDEFLAICIMAGADKIPCTLHVEKFQIGEGPLPKE